MMSSHLNPLQLRIMASTITQYLLGIAAPISRIFSVVGIQPVTTVTSGAKFLMPSLLIGSRKMVASREVTVTTLEQNC